MADKWKHVKAGSIVEGDTIIDPADGERFKVIGVTKWFTAIELVSDDYEKEIVFNQSDIVKRLVTKHD